MMIATWRGGGGGAAGATRLTGGASIDFKDFMTQSV
jgi:hypothetical protein